LTSEAGVACYQVVEMPSTGEFSLLLAKAPEQFGKLQPELAAKLPQVCKEHRQSNPFRQTFALERQRAEELPVDAVQYMNFGCLHN
jgi:hypothetical protein